MNKTDLRKLKSYASAKWPELKKEGTSDLIHEAIRVALEGSTGIAGDDLIAAAKKAMPPLLRKALSERRRGARVPRGAPAPDAGLQIQPQRRPRGPRPPHTPKGLAKIESGGRVDYIPVPVGDPLDADMRVVIDRLASVKRQELLTPLRH